MGNAALVALYGHAASKSRDLYRSDFCFGRINGRARHNTADRRQGKDKARYENRA
jgi:hypothetical protein